MTLINKVVSFTVNNQPKEEVKMTTAVPELSHENLLYILRYDIGRKAHGVFNAMQAVLTTPQLRWEFLERRDNSKYAHNEFFILCDMRKEQLKKQTEQATIDFLHNYRFDPLKAISEYLMDTTIEFTLEDWLRRGGTPEKLIEIKRHDNEVTLTKAIKILTYGH